MNNISFPVSAVIFDMDGVIFDSERAIYEGWLDLAERVGLPDIESVYRLTIGVNAAAAKAVFQQHYGTELPYDAFKAEISKEYHRKYDGGRLPVKPGIRETLPVLKQQGLKLAVASSTRSALVRQQLKAAGLLCFFDELIGGEAVTRSKPAPDIFLEAARRLSCVPQQSIVIEDSYNGIRAAYDGDFMPVMIPDLLPADEEMMKKTIAILPSAAELPAYLFTARVVE